MPVLNLSFSLSQAQQQFIDEYIAPTFNTGEVISFETIEMISDLSEDVFDFDEWEELNIALLWA